jgi:hypothetical protein
LGDHPLDTPRYYFNTFQVKKFPRSTNMLQKMHSTESPIRCFSQLAMLPSTSIGGYPLIVIGGMAMATNPQTQFQKVVHALIIFNPHQTHDPIDARDIAAVTDLSAKQASPFLSILKSLGYLAKVGSAHRYSRYIRTLKPLTDTPTLLLRAYQARSIRAMQGDCSPRRPDTSTENFTIPVKIPLTKLGQRPLAPHSSNPSAQLSLFPLSTGSVARSRDKGSMTARRS